MKVIKYETTDFYLTAVYMAAGYELLSLTETSPKRYTFTLNVSPSTAHQLSLQYWKRELAIPLRDFVDALHELKTRMYAKN